MKEPQSLLENIRVSLLSLAQPFSKSAATTSNGCQSSLGMGLKTYFRALREESGWTQPSESPGMQIPFQQPAPTAAVRASLTPPAPTCPRTTLEGGIAGGGIWDQAWKGFSSLDKWSEAAGEPPTCAAAAGMPDTG